MTPDQWKSAEKEAARFIGYDAPTQEIWLALGFQELTARMNELGAMLGLSPNTSHSELYKAIKVAFGAALATCRGSDAARYALAMESKK